MITTTHSHKHWTDKGGHVTSVLLSPAVVGGLRHLDHTAVIGDGFALGDQLLGGLERSDDLLRRVPRPFHAQVPSPVWPA
jgi:hypothetical protein